MFKGSIKAIFGGIKKARRLKIILSILGFVGVFGVLKKFFPQLNMLWTNFTDGLSIGFSILLMIVGIVGIIGTIVVFLVILNKDEKSNTEESTIDKSTKKTLKTNESVLLAASSILCCIFMVPTIAGFNSYSLKKYQKNKHAEIDREVKNALLEIETLKNKQRLAEQQNTIEQQYIEINALKDSLRLLENTQLNVQNFKEILQVALLETDFKQTSVYRGPLNKAEQNKFFWVFDKERISL